MSEEEKKAIEGLKDYVARIKKFHFEQTQGFKWVDITLNLLDNQQKELDMQIEHNKELDKTLYAKQSMIDELTQNEEQLKIELGKEKENLKIAVAMLTKGTYPEENEGDNDFNKQFIAVDKIKEMKKYREFELQQEYKEFEEDVEWRTYKKILEGK